MSDNETVGHPLLPLETFATRKDQAVPTHRPTLDTIASFIIFGIDVPSA